VIKKLILFIIIALIAISTSLFLYTKHEIKQPLNIKETQLFTVPDGMSFHRFSKTLTDSGWLESRFWLRNFVRLNPELANIKAGTYQVEKNTSLLSLLEKIVEGKEHQFSVTFIEGSTFKEWLTILKNTKYLVQQLNNDSISNIAEKLAISHKNPEGLFYPDTYAFTANTADIDILKRAQQKMSRELTKAWQNRQENLPYKNKYQALIMASIIEKESGRHAEHGVISSVFINRLNIKMRLQTDPTIIYGLGERYKGDIKRIHKREKTAYNTYRINGLPNTNCHGR